MSDRNSTEFYIDSLWILENQSGICLFEENYVDFRNEGISTDLISSFLSAILTFADEAFAEEIQHIKFSNRRILFEFSDQVLFILAVGDESASDSQIKKIFDQIAKKFNEQFHSALENFNGNVQQFEIFSEYLTKLVKKEPLSVKILQALDFKENFKKVEEYFNKKFAKLQRRMAELDSFFKKKFEKVETTHKLKKLLKNKRKLEKKLHK